MKKIFFALATISAALILSLGSTASASAQAPQAPTAPADVSATANDVDVQQSCRARFSQGVNHRASASAGSTSLGIVPANTWVSAACSLTAGGSYTACGITSNQWLRVYWNGRWGYSAWACLANWEYV